MRRRALSHLLGRTIVGRRGVELWAGQLRCRVASNNSISCSTRATGVACVTARAGSRLPGDDGWRTADERRTTLVVPRTSLCERATPALAARPSPVRSAAESIRQSSRDGVRLLHFSVQRDHVHLLVEADAPCRLTGGSGSCERQEARARGRRHRRAVFRAMVRRMEARPARTDDALPGRTLAHLAGARGMATSRLDRVRRIPASCMMKDGSRDGGLPRARTPTRQHDLAGGVPTAPRASDLPWT